MLDFCLTYIQIAKLKMKLLTPYKIASLILSNRIIRSATFEGMADAKGFPTNEYYKLYENLSKQNIGALICGFSYVSPEGKAMQLGQIGVDSPDKIPSLKKLTDIVHNNEGKIFMQIAHTGRQTLKSVIGQNVLSSSSKRSIYFNQKPVSISIKQIESIVDKFGNSALYCKQAGFDGIQIHAAHGYLIHQFLTPAINKRKDKYGIDAKTKIGTTFLKEIIENIREKCGENFPVLIKVSGSDDLFPKFNKQQFINLISFIDTQAIDAIEISYGTMDYALNIFRGDLPTELILTKNPIYKTENKFKRFLIKTFVFSYMKSKLKPFSPSYNLDYALIAKSLTIKPIICVGGYRNKNEIESTLSKDIDFVSICRPFICEPDFKKKITSNPNYESKCTNCNKCAIMCDTEYSTKCYMKYKF